MNLVHLWIKSASYDCWGHCSSLNPTSEARPPALASAHPHPPPPSKAQAQLPTLQFLQVLTWRQYWASNFTLPRSTLPPQFCSLQTNRIRLLTTQSNSRDKRHAAFHHLNVALAENIKGFQQIRSKNEMNGGTYVWLCRLIYIHRWRSLTGYGPWVHKESDTTEQLIHFHFLWVIKTCKQCKWLITK